MKMSRILCTAALVLALWPGMAQAEFYKYKDASGALRFTDDISEVPEDQRPQTYEGVNDGLTEEQRAAKKAEKAARSAVRKQQYGLMDSAAPSTSADRSFAKLKKEEKALEKLGKELRAEQAGLISAQENDPTPAESAAINSKIASLNSRIADYERRRQTLMKKIDAYNRMVQNSQD